MLARINSYRSVLVDSRSETFLRRYMAASLVQEAANPIQTRYFMAAGKPAE